MLPWLDCTGNWPVWSENDLHIDSVVMRARKRLFVLGLLGSWLGARSKEVDIGMESRSGLVDLICFCWPRRWPLLVAIDLGRCFRMRDSVRPGQGVK